jgi:hypothetical protein
MRGSGWRFDEVTAPRAAGPALADDVGRRAAAIAARVKEPKENVVVGAASGWRRIEREDVPDGLGPSTPSSMRSDERVVKESGMTPGLIACIQPLP